MLRENGVLTSVKGDRFTSHQDDVRSLIMSFHLEVALLLALLPLRTGGEIQTRRLVCLAANIPRANNRMAIGNSKIQQTPRLHPRHPRMLLWNLPDKLINLRNRLHHHPSKQRLPKPLRPRIRTRIHPFPLQQIQEQRKRPLAIRPTLNTQIPPVRERRPQRTLHILPAANVAVVHEHQRLVLEGMAVVVRKGTFGRRAHVREDQVRACLTG